MMHAKCNIPETKSVTPSKTIYSVDNAILIFVKLVTCKFFCLENYTKCYYESFMDQLTITQAFPKRCKKSYKSKTLLQLHHTSETGFTSVNYASKINAEITHESLPKRSVSQNGISDRKTLCKSTYCQN